jgi:ankyrin repeat protein
MLAGDTGDRQPRPLPHVVVIDLRDRRADAVLEMRLGRAHVVALLLQRVRVRKVQLAREDADEAARHASIEPEILTPATIFELIDAGDADGLRALLRDDPEAAASRDEQGLSPLMRATYRGNREIAALLRPLDAWDRLVTGEADGLPAPDARSPDGFTPLHLAVFGRNPAAAKALIEAGADLDAISSATFAQVTPLGTAAAFGVDDLARLLLHAGADPNATGDHGSTPLHAAATNGNRELVELLLAHGASSAVRNRHGRTPAEIAPELFG